MSDKSRAAAVTTDPVSRRHFLKVAGITAVAASATGAGAAMLAKQQATLPSVITTLPTPDVPSVAQVAVSAHTEMADLLGQLASTQAENLRLQAALQSAQRRLDVQRSETDAAGAVTEPLLLELEEAHAQLGMFGGLLALYEQLDDVDMAEVWEEGVTAVTTALDDLLDDTPTLRDGVAAGRQALQDLETHLPQIQEGREWLANSLGRLQYYFANLQQLLENAVAAAGSFLDVLNQWFQDILRWLPFGIGERTATIMESLGQLLGEIPIVLSDVHLNVNEPLDVWLGKQPGEETPLQKDLIKPMRQDVLDKASSVVSKTSEVKATYQTQLTSMNTAVARRQLVRDLIAQYREQHGVG